MEVNDAVALDCGRDPSTVWEHAHARTLDEHERSCPYCRVVVDDERSAATATSLLAQATGAPSSTGFGELVPNVMATIRAQLRAGRHVRLPSPAGPASATEYTIATAVRHALDGLPDVEARTCRVNEVGDDESEVRPLAIRVTVSLAYGRDVTGVADAVRAEITEVLARRFGLGTAAVDIAVDDVFQDEP